jgi:hypothetical protein
MLLWLVLVLKSLDDPIYTGGWGGGEGLLRSVPRVWVILAFEIVGLHALLGPTVRLWRVVLVFTLCLILWVWEQATSHTCAPAWFYLNGKFLSAVLIGLLVLALAAIIRKASTKSAESLQP